jgi:hypothetical protein
MLAEVVALGNWQEDSTACLLSSAELVYSRHLRR